MQSLPLLATEPIARDGYTVAQAVYSARECGRLAEEIRLALEGCPDEKASLRRASGEIYGARNLLTLFPLAMELWRRPPLVELLTAVLGSQFGLVRGLFFDKPPANTWSLPWHRDLTIAVRDHSLASTHFRSPTTKAGVPHVEAPDPVLQQMLTLRIHLDDATPENGPLKVVPESHHSRYANSSRSPVTIYAQAGDVLAMRPLLMHASEESRAGTDRHRRIIHLEFAAMRELPDNYEWQCFISA